MLPRFYRSRQNQRGKCSRSTVVRHVRTRLLAASPSSSSKAAFAGSIVQKSVLFLCFSRRFQTGGNRVQPPHDSDRILNIDEFAVQPETLGQMFPECLYAVSLGGMVPGCNKRNA